jgi:hypothetical protein
VLGGESARLDTQANLAASPRFERVGKRCGQIRIGKAPADHRSIGVVFAVATLWLDAVLSMKRVHRIEACSETAHRHDDVNVMRKFLLDARRFELAFVAGHSRPLAERVGFEPTNALRRCQFSRLVPSTTRPPLQTFSRIVLDCLSNFFPLLLTLC